MATLAEQLVNVQAAIEAAESAQSVSGGGRSRQMAEGAGLNGRGGGSRISALNDCQFSLCLNPRTDT
ncbi:MAG: hypothetical protein K9N55_21030 [Phycisphaerae bacterium]|nr:hypothetical protein [Phycisphaerae bacterium]